MFTGIIEEIGIIRDLRQKSAGATILIHAGRIGPDLEPGESVAVNGVCLTVVETRGQNFSCDLSAETLRRSSLGLAKEGMPVNLERALTVGDRLGGHVVQGHVDGVGRLVSTASSGEGADMEFSVPAEFQPYLVTKGSVAVDGISLTVASLKKNGFTVAVIPLTLQVTNLHRLKAGDPVNLEGDILAKYVERLLQFSADREPVSGRKLTIESLREQGY